MGDGDVHKFGAGLFSAIDLGSFGMKLEPRKDPVNDMWWGLGIASVANRCR